MEITLAPCSSSPSSKKAPSLELSRFENGVRASKQSQQEDAPSQSLLSTDINGSEPTEAPSIEDGPNPTVDIPLSQPSRSLDKGKTIVKKKKIPPTKASSSCSSSSSSSYFPRSSAAISASSSLRQKGAGVAIRRRVPTLGFRNGSGGNDLHDLALPLGMSVAAVITQVLERKDAVGDRVSADHLSMICSAAVKESIESVFGDRFDSFLKNFEKSFGSTLKTLRLLNEASPDEQQNYLCTSDVRDLSSEEPPVLPIHELPAGFQDTHASMQSNPINHQLILHEQINQELTGFSQNTSASGYNQSVLSTFEKSVMEQARSNDLKAFEIALVMKKLQLKESQLALSSAANLLERVKICMGISKASFKEEKLKNQILDTRHAELLKKCTDCLVAGLLIMSACLVYGAYIYSYKRISEATFFCTSSPQESKSWWFPNPMASVNSTVHMLRCYVVVASRMLFGVLMILALAYSLLQRAALSRQTPMLPVTFILLLLGVACGFAGKLCVATLGGCGYVWLLYWEVLCLLHYFANAFTPALFYVLHGPVSVTQDIEGVRLPYWIRRIAFYGTVLLILPMLCGLMPFASPLGWMRHFSSLASDKLLIPTFGDGS